MLHYARQMMKGGVTTPAVTVSGITPSSQSDSNSLASKTFNSCNITVTGGTPSSIVWDFDTIDGGNWTINSGQGTLSAVPRVTNALLDYDNAATLSCTVTVDGVEYVRTAALSYYRTI